MDNKELQKYIDSLNKGLLGRRTEHQWDSARRMSMINATDNPAKRPSVKKKLKGRTYSEEAKQKISESMRKAAEKRGHLKEVAQYTLEGELVRTWSCVKDAAKALGCAPGSIRGCVRGRQKSSQGFIWKYT